MLFTNRELRRIARDKLSGNWGTAILVSIFAAILQGGKIGGFTVSFRMEGMDVTNLNEVISFFSHLFREFSFPLALSGLCSLVLFVIGSAVGLGRREYFLNLCAEEERGFGDLFSRFPILLKALGLQLYMALFIFLWSLLFFIPGIVAAYRYALAPYLMAQNPEMGIREAVRRSKTLMKGHKGRLFSLQFSFLGWAFLSCLSLGIGFIWLIPYIHGAETAFYMDLSGQRIPVRQS